MNIVHTDWKIKPYWIAKFYNPLVLNDLCCILEDQIFNPQGINNLPIFEHIQSIRQQKLEHWYPGRNCRLHNCIIHDNTITLQLQEIEYGWSSALWGSYDIVKDLLISWNMDYLSHWISIALCIKTTDWLYVFGKRPHGSFLPYDFVGWIVEMPSKFNDTKYREIYDNLSDKKKINFLYTSSLKELKEELSIGINDINWSPTLSWIIVGWLGRYIAVVNINVWLTMLEIQKRFNQLEVKEFDSLEFFTHTEFIQFLSNQSLIKQLIGEWLQNTL